MNDSLLFSFFVILLIAMGFVFGFITCYFATMGDKRREIEKPLLKKKGRSK